MIALAVLKARIHGLRLDVERMDWNELAGLGDVLDALQMAETLAERVRPLTDEERSFYAKQRQIDYDAG